MNSLIVERKNDTFSEFKGDDLHFLLSCIKDYSLSYRESLSFPNKFTFGTEIEYENIERNIVENFVKKNNELQGWTSVEDYSIKIGGEVKSPILRDDKEHWQELKTICSFLKENNAVTTKNAGGHIHLGANYLGTDKNAWENFLKMWAGYEHVIYRFGYGEMLIPRFSLERFAKPIAKSIFAYDCIFEDWEHVEDMLENFDALIKGGLSFSHLYTQNLDQAKFMNTLEVRCPNATVDEVIWQNNVNFFGKMLMSSKELDEDFLRYRYYKRKNDLIDFEDYQQIYLNDALELADLVFDNNLDKCYFLKQYLKNFEMHVPGNKEIMAKKFTRSTKK